MVSGAMEEGERQREEDERIMYRLLSMATKTLL